MGKTFVFTGSLQSITRKEGKEIIEARGGRAAGSVSAKTDCIVAGENAGFKLKKAEKLGIPVLTESEFMDLIK